MRSVFVAVALLTAQAVLGQEQATPSAEQPVQPKAPAAAAAPEGQPQVVNKPVISDADLAAAGRSEQAVPLHRHPVLLRMLLRNNQVRGGVGLRGHRLHPALARAAQDHANYMARTRDFSHYSNLGPSGRAQKYGYSSGVLENIAYGYPSIDAAFTGWQNSGGHWANMSSHTADAGFGYAVSADGTAYWVAVYGNSPVSDEAVVDGESAPGEASDAAADPAPPGAPAAAAAEQNAPAPTATYSGNSGRRRLIFRHR